GALTGSPNYALSFIGFYLTAAAARVTLVAGADAKVYGDLDPALAYSASGFKLSDTAASVLSGDLIRAAGEDVGVYAITAGTLAAMARASRRDTGHVRRVTP